MRCGSLGSRGNFKKILALGSTVPNRQRKIDLKIKAFEPTVFKELGKIIL